MSKLSSGDRLKLVEAARGKRPCTMVIKDIKFVNVFTGEIYPAEVGIYKDYIAHVKHLTGEKENGEEGDWQAKNVISGGNNYLIPGLVDTHVHIESSMLTPENFARIALKNGTTTAVIDPHEIANVAGKEGVKYMLSASRGLPMDQYVLVPSCVPAVPGLEGAGAKFSGEDIGELLQKERVLGLAEVMDYPGVIDGSARMRKIIQAALDNNSVIQGHAPGLTGRSLSAYLCAGPKSDHETASTEEAKEKLRSGMTLDLRESSIAQNLERLIPALEGMNSPINLTFCSDDREAEELLHQGHLNYVVARAIEEGMESVEAIRSATLKAARSFGLNKHGAIAPGYLADMLLVPSLKDLKPEAVFYRGKKVVEEGELRAEFPRRSFDMEQKNTVKLPRLQKKHFRIGGKCLTGKVTANIIEYPGQDDAYTDFALRELQLQDGFLSDEDCDDLNYVAVFNRHGEEDMTVTLIENFGLKEGALASTVAHDSHNLVVVASRPEDGLKAARRLNSQGGGMVCVEDGEVCAFIELPIGGLMSSLKASKLAPAIKNFKERLSSMGFKEENPLLKITSLTLPVIPRARITDRGLVDVKTQSLRPVIDES